MTEFLQMQDMNDWKNSGILEEKMLSWVQASCLRHLGVSEISGAMVTRTEGKYQGCTYNSFLPPLETLGSLLMTLNLVLRWEG